ncbi:MAG TPA: CHAT domain-containing tetratricopeptide repeat protein [Candidatus Aquilonibacter sp.]|nr:CHAT domain-containing tetratricopeptide repeat protein [Candidatus Aquilonibacter sp.]
MAVRRKLIQGAAEGFLSHFAEAQQRFAEAEALATRYHPELLGDLALRRGTLCFLQDQSAAAESHFRAALQLARQQQDPFLQVASLGSLGLIAAQQEHYDESIDWDRAALDLARSIGDQGSEGRILGNMAWSLFELGDYENSAALFRQAEESASKRGNIGTELAWSIDIGGVDSYLREFSLAEQETRKALSLAQQLDQQDQVARSENVLADIALKTGRIQDAEDSNEQALKIFRANGDHAGVVSSTLIEGRIEGERRDTSAAKQSLQQVIHDPLAVPSARWAAEARLATVYANAGMPAAAAKEFRASLATVEKARSSVTEESMRVSFLANAIEFYDDYVGFLVTQHRDEQALSLAADTRSQTLLEGLNLDPARTKIRASASDWTQAARRTRSVILTYWLGTRHSYLWAITPSGTIRLFVLPPQDRIDPIVRSYDQALLGPRDALETENPDGERLFRMLVAPAAGLIPKSSRVVIVPDGSLCNLNFETLLVASATPHYWIDDVDVSYADSLLLVAAERPAAPPEHPRMLLIGDPLSPSDEFPPLPQAAAEMSDIEKYFPAHETTRISGRNATPQAYFESMPGQFAYIHFVAHATSSELRPLESSVVLSKQGDTFKLYGRDIVKIPLKARLVTISACSGVGSRNYSGEGIVGLSWAFLRAGAQGVIAALWEVDDSSTAMLMDRFYEQLSKGLDPPTALRNAKLALLHSGTVYKKPFYWAPFQYYAGL